MPDDKMCKKQYENWLICEVQDDFILIHVLVNWCTNALDLSNSKLIVDNNWPFGIYCQWLISAVDDKHYVNLEFENFDVSIAEFTYPPLEFLI